jgi:hypothetical protein
MKKARCKVALICILFPFVSIAQDNAAEQKLQKAGYLLSIESIRLEIIRTDLSKITKKNNVFNGLDNSQIIHITLLIENIVFLQKPYVHTSAASGRERPVKSEKKLHFCNKRCSFIREFIIKNIG